MSTADSPRMCRGTMYRCEATTCSRGLLTGTSPMLGPSWGRPRAPLTDRHDGLKRTGSTPHPCRVECRSRRLVPGALPDGVAGCAGHRFSPFVCGIPSPKGSALTTLAFLDSSTLAVLPHSSHGSASATKGKTKDPVTRGPREKQSTT